MQCFLTKSLLHQTYRYENKGNVWCLIKFFQLVKRSTWRTLRRIRMLILWLKGLNRSLFQQLTGSSTTQEAHFSSGIFKQNTCLPRIQRPLSIHEKMLRQLIWLTTIGHRKQGESPVDPRGTGALSGRCIKVSHH